MPITSHLSLSVTACEPTTMSEAVVMEPPRPGGFLESSCGAGDSAPSLVDTAKYVQHARQDMHFYITVWGFIQSSFYIIHFRFVRVKKPDVFISSVLLKTQHSALEVIAAQYETSEEDHKPKKLGNNWFRVRYRHRLQHYSLDSWLALWTGCV